MEDDDEKKSNCFAKIKFLKVVGDGLGTLVEVPMATKKCYSTQKYKFLTNKKKFGN